MGKIKFLLALPMMLLATMALAHLSGTIVSWEDYDAPEPMDPWISVAKEDSYFKTFGITSAGTGVKCEYTGWSYWAYGPDGFPWHQGSIQVDVNGVTVDAMLYDTPMAKTITPNIIYSYEVQQAQLNYGWNTVVFRCSMPNGYGDADYWFYELQVYRSDDPIGLKLKS